MNLIKLTAVISAVLLAGCWEHDPDSAVFIFDLDQEAQGWQAGFADYPAGAEVLYELDSEWKMLPAPLASMSGIYISGNNHSDDLFMYLKHRLTGLKPYTRYALSFAVEFATNADAGCFGIGGAPGEGVVVKAGATEHEPLADQESQGFIRMNIDHGDQTSGGSDAVVIGNIASTQTDCTDDLYELKELTSAGVPFEAITGRQGVLWTLFATDSGYEGTTSLYFTRLEIIAEEI